MSAVSETNGMVDEAVARRLYFDTNIFLAAFETASDFSRKIALVFDRLEQQPRRAVTSAIALAELLGKESLVLGWNQQSRIYTDLLIFSGFIDLRPVSRDILNATGDYRRAALRSGRKASLPDAIHVVTALRAGCRYIFTADKRLVVPAPLELIRLDADGASSIGQILDA